MDKSMLAYWWSVLRSAFIASLDTIGQTIGTLFFGVIALVVGFCVIWHREGLGAMKEDITKTILEVLSVAVMAWIPFFLWSLARTPYLIHQEQKRATESASKAESLALEKVKEYETPKLALLWAPTDHPYRWWDYTKKPPSLYFGFGVKNISGVTIRGVKISLQQIDPEPPSSYAPCPIRLRHNILPGNPPIREFDLTPGEERIAQLMVQAENLDFFWMLTAIDTIPDWTIPIHPYRFHIRVFSSTPGPVAFGTFELYKDGNLWNMKEIPS